LDIPVILWPVIKTIINSRLFGTCVDFYSQKRGNSSEIAGKALDSRAVQDEIITLFFNPLTTDS
jgi:hypothetical protein